MNQRSRDRNSPRSVATLATGIEKRLISYAAMATAAGVAILACAPSAEAKVVYTATWMSIVPKGQPALIDLNNDGIADFQVSTTHQLISTRSGFRSVSFKLNVSPKNASNAIWGANGSASALPAGKKVGPSGKLKLGKQFMASQKFESTSYFGSYIYRASSNGQWPQTTRLYLGLRFIIQGQIHYGWARLNVTAAASEMYGAVNGFAYETEPNKPIITGQGAPREGRSDGNRSAAGRPRGINPGGLGALAAGAPAIQRSRQQNAGSK